MSTTTIPNPDERQNSQERGSKNERLRKVQAFVQDVLRPVDTTLGEQKAQRDEVKKFESRPYQLEAWDALWRTREEGGDRALIHLATGLGKTSVAVFDYAKFRVEQEAKGETARALFVVHQNAILDQADERFNEVLPHLLPGVGMSRYSNKSDILPSGEVTFASFQALNLGAYKIPSNYFDYIVYDEVHHMEAKTYKKVVEHFTPKFQLGLTATPERGDGKNITDHFGEARYSKTLPEGIAEGYLANVHYRLMLDEHTKQLLENGFRPRSMAQLKKMFEVEPSAGDVAEVVKTAQQELRDKTGLEKIKTIIFDPSIDMADTMAEIMGGKSYHSGKSNDNEATLRAFRNGELETIVTRDMFNEGVDIPDAMLIVFRRSSQSKTIFEQQLGRGLRKTDTKSEVTVLDFVANAERIRLLRDLDKEVREQQRKIRNSVVNHPELDENENRDGDLSIGASNSEFEFDSQIIDILDLYNYFHERSSDRVDWSLWTSDELIELAKQLSPDAPLSSVDIDRLSKEKEFPSRNTIYSRFQREGENRQSLAAFHEACGFEIQTHTDWSAWMNEELIKLALEISPDKKLRAEDLIRLSRNKRFPSLYYITADARFGSLADFQRACGFDVKEHIHWAEWSNQSLVEIAKKLSPNRPLNQYDLAELSKSNEFPSSSMIKKKFGSIANFQRTCGFEVKENIDWKQASDDEILALARALSSSQPLKARDIEQLAKVRLFPNPKSIVARFGSIVDFQRACGFNVADWSKVTDEELIELAKQLSPDKPLGSRDMVDDSFPNEKVITIRFGSIIKFQRACGFEVKERTNWINVSNDEIIQLANQLSPHKKITVVILGDISKDGQFPTLLTIQNRFGSLTAFQRACGFEI